MYNKIDEIIEYIKLNKVELNLTFNDSIIKEQSTSPNQSKIKILKKQPNTMVAIIPFYKKITRFL